VPYRGFFGQKGMRETVSSKAKDRLQKIGGGESDEGHKQACNPVGFPATPIPESFGQRKVKKEKIIFPNYM
jgi:hypothetical protein